MKTLKVKLCAILCMVAVLCFGAMFAFAPKANVSASALSADAFQTMGEASIRKAEDNGIRFRTYIGNNKLAAVTSAHEIGTLFIPASILGDNVLTYEGVYGGKTPVAAVWDGDTTKLTDAEGYENGKFFNAVLNLTDFASEKDVLNGKIVARGYMIDKSTNQVLYAGEQVSLAPAYVAYKALNEEDESGYIKAYTKYLTSVDVLNVGSWETINKWGEYVPLPTIVVDGITAESYSVADGVITRAEAYQGDPLLKPIAKVVDTNDDSVMDSIIGLDEGYSVLNITTTDGIVIEVPLTVSLPQVAFVNGTFKPKADSVFTVRASNVAKVEFAMLGSKVGAAGTYTAVEEPVYTVVDSSKITYPEINDDDSDKIKAAKKDVLTIKKSDLIDFASLTLTEKEKCDGGGEEGAGSYYNYELRITTTGGAVSTVPVYVRQATRVNFTTTNGGYIDELVFLDAKLQMLYLGGLTMDGTTTTAYMPTMAGEGDALYAWYNLNTEWLQALIEMYPSGAPNIQMLWTFKKADNGTTATFSYVEGANVGKDGWLGNTPSLRGNKSFDATASSGTSRCSYLFGPTPVSNYFNGNSATLGDVNVNYITDISGATAVSAIGFKLVQFS